MPIKKKRCLICRRWFTPDPRTSHQVCCTDPECRRQHKAAMDKQWRQANPDYDKSRAVKKRVWARGLDYWRRYRRTHPIYATADNKRRHKAHLARKSAANQVVIRKIAVEKLASLREIGLDSAANQVVIARRVEVIVDYLFPEEVAANPKGTDLWLPRGP